MQREYGLNPGKWNRDSMCGDHYLEAGPDDFSAGVFVDEIRADRDSALEGMRLRYEEGS